MALSTPSESPAVVVREIDLTGGVPNVQSTTGAFVGNFRWGPIGERRLIANETELAATFGTPSITTSASFLSAAQFLKYSSSLYVVRETADSAGTGANSAIGWHDGASDTLNASFTLRVKNDEEFRSNETGITAFDSDGYGNNGQVLFTARYPGALGNSLKVSILPADTTDSNFDNWMYSGSFDAKPTTSNWATAKGASGDQVLVAVVDEDGLFTGVKGTVLETFKDVSILRDAKNDVGQSIFVKDVINNTSEYVRMFNFTPALDSAGAGDTVTNDTAYFVDSADRMYVDVSFQNGQDTGLLGTQDILQGFDLFEDKDQVEVDFLIAPGAINSTAQTTIVNDLVATAQSIRKDCIVVTSPDRTSILSTSNDATRVTNTLNAISGFTKSSYLVVDNNYIKVYDKYNDQYTYIAAASTTAGIMASTDINQAPWYSPAGSRRGQLLGVTALAYSPTKGQRDQLYKAGVNPIANIPGQGVLLFGDKTFLGRVSAFDRINVRRLFLVLERAIGRAAEQVLFEFNDEFTRAEFVNIVEPVLREVQGRRGITDFRVVCDETNNTPAVVDRNEFIASIFIKPARSINFVTLNFVAVRTGVDFNEVVGTV